MKTCAGCKHLFRWGNRGYCREAVLPAEYVVDPSSGIGGYRERLKYGLSWRGNTTEDLTKHGMPCGPDRQLYEPRLLTTLLNKLTSKLISK